jgi:tetratricopeptide (TPR) repeat protein
MKKMTYWWARLSPWMKSALLAGVLCLLIVAGSAVIFDSQPWGWQAWAQLIFVAFAASLTTVRAVLTIREKLPGPKIRPAKEGELLIIVAKFRGPESPDPQMYIARRLEADLLLHPALADRVRVSRFPEAIEQERPVAEVKKARALAETYGATLVIWGEHDGHSVAPHYLTTRERARVARIVELPPTAATADLNEFVMYVSEELPETLTYLSLFTIGQMYYFADEYSQALSLFSTALDHFPSGEAYQESAVALHFYRGTTYSHLGKQNLALGDFDRSIELGPDWAHAYYNRGSVYTHKGDYDLAIADLNKAIKLDPDFAEAYGQRGLTYDRKGDYDQALADHDRAIDLKPDNALAYANRGVTYARKGDYDLAITDLNKAIKLDPDDAVAYDNRGGVHARKGDYDLAIADLNKAIKLDPDDVLAYMGRVGVYSLKGDYDLAIADLNKVMELKPDAAEAYNKRGIVYALKGDYDQALADHDRAIDLKPDNALAYANRGVTYARKGDYDLAIADLNKAIKLDPDNALAYFRRGNVYSIKGDYDLVIADFDRAIELRADHVEEVFFRLLFLLEFQTAVKGITGDLRKKEKELLKELWELGEGREV